MNTDIQKIVGKAQKIFVEFYKGRLNRRNYFLGQLLVLIVSVLLQGLLSTGDSLSVGIAIILACVTLAFSVSLVMRRLHDLGYSGWWSILVYVVNIISLLLLFVPGNKQANAYGNVPNEHIHIAEDIFLKSHTIKHI